MACGTNAGKQNSDGRMTTTNFKNYVTSVSPHGTNQYKYSSRIKPRALGFGHLVLTSPHSCGSIGTSQSREPFQLLASLFRGSLPTPRFRPVRRHSSSAISSPTPTFAWAPPFILFTAVRNLVHLSLGSMLIGAPRHIELSMSSAG